MSQAPVATGLVTALTTPFTKGDRIDLGALRAHLAYLWEGGVTHLLVGGTTGEFFSLSRTERIHLLDAVAAAWRGAVMFHAGAGSLGDTVYLVRQAADHGAHSVAVITPYYLQSPAVTGVVHYFDKVRAACRCPLVLYHFPKHTQVALDAEAVRRIAPDAIKDSSADFSLISAAPYLVGSDTKVVDAYAAGAAGFVSARANVRPRLYADLVEAMEARQTEAVRRLHAEVRAVCATLSGPHQIALIKMELAHKVPGYPTAVRPPLIGP